MREAHNTICKALGNPEVLIYNAGPGMMSWPPPTIMDIPPEVFSRAFDSGVTGALVWAQQVGHASGYHVSNALEEQA